MAFSNSGRSLLFFGLLIFLSNPADGIVTVDDVNSLRQRAGQTCNDFYADSFKLRMKYEFNQQLLTTKEKKQLLDSSKQASEQLVQIIEKQKNLKDQIEDYYGDDWDQKYGLTGLWRKLTQDVYLSTLSKCRIDLYIAAVSTKKQKLLLQNILTQIDSTSQRYDSAYLQLLKAKVSVMLGEEKPEKLYTLTKELVSNNSEQDIELILSLAILQRRYEPADFEKTLRQCHRIEPFLASLILEELSGNFEQTTVLDAELAAMAAWKQQTQNHKKLLKYLSQKERLQTPLILYVTAASLGDSSPSDSVNLLIRAGQLQQQRKSDRLNLAPETIAQQAAQLASSYYSKDQINWASASKAFENYYTIDGKNADKDLGQLLYFAFGNSNNENKKLAELIAKKTNGQWRNTARVELKKIAFETSQHKDNENLPHKVNEAITCMLTVIEPNNCRYADFAIELLSVVFDKIEMTELSAVDFNQLMGNYKKLARICYDCSGDQGRFELGLFLAESSLLSTIEITELLDIDKLLDELAKNDSQSIDLLRCRARLLTAQGKYKKAADSWMRVCRIRNKQSWKWWRAKFYELDCLSKSSPGQADTVLHAIEVLQATFADIPSLWAEKLGQLSEQCRNQLNSTGK
ncbi:hypothetical protein ACFL3G_00960 [Planctomycetota bacterium]